VVLKKVRSLKYIEKGLLGWVIKSSGSKMKILVLERRSVVMQKISESK